MAIERADELLTVAAVADRLKVHPITVRRLIKAGRLPVVRVGRAVRVRASDVDAFARPEGAAGAGRPHRRPPTRDEIEQRRKAVNRIRAIRDRMKPLGMTTTELIREGRVELERRAERHHGRRR
jgi:excisionase family DNA binding protein